MQANDPMALVSAIVVLLCAAFDGRQYSTIFRTPRATQAEQRGRRCDCQVTFLPNFGGTGNLLVISGTDTEGTETGAEFLTTEAGMAKLRRHLQVDAAGRLPYFELILKSPRIGGSSPVCEIAALRKARS